MHINQSQRPWVQGVGAAFALLAAFHTHAQGISNAAAQAASAEQPFNFSYRSVLTGYQPYADSKIESWAKANQTVQELGGWKAYAKEPAASVEQKNPAPHNHSMPMGHPHGGHK